jgi:glucosamine-6-phosphate deaminase
MRPVKPIYIQTVGRLRVEVYPDRKQMGAAAAGQVARRMREILAESGRVRMVFASAPSQDEFLHELAAQEGIDWSRVTAFHMDEYIGLALNDPRAFGQFLEDRLFYRVRPRVFHRINPSGSLEEECRRYARLIREEPIDIVCLGIGENGHLAFNDPPVADFHDPHVIKAVELEEACRLQQVHDGCFAHLDEVPRTALTLTIPTLLSGRYLFCIVPGPTKRKAVASTLYGPITTKCPASILREHEGCVLFLDADSFGDGSDDEE